MPERQMEVEPVVSYSLLPPEEGKPMGLEDERVEPRLTVIPMSRRERHDEIAAPSASEVAEHSTVRFEAQSIDPLPADPREKRGRRRSPGAGILGLAALLIGVGILAATFGKVVTGGNVVTTAPSVDQTTITLAPPPPATEDTAGPGVRVIPGAEPAPVDMTSSQPAPATTAQAEGAAAATVEKPPQPRLRPTTSETSDSLVLSAPTVPAPQALALPAHSEPVPPPAPAASGDDVGALMANVDKLLAERRAAAPQPVAPQLAATANPGVAMLGGAASALRTGQPATEFPSRVPGRDVLLFPDGEGGLPVPPADIPNPEGAAGQ